MAINILLVGRTRPVLHDAAGRAKFPNVEYVAAASLAEAIDALQHHTIDHVIMGAGLDIDVRMEIVRSVFRLSQSTSVHMKDAASGPTGFLPFVRSIVGGILAR
jgi:hypothetical protein